jgi:hypothetical protein
MVLTLLKKGKTRHKGDDMKKIACFFIMALLVFSFVMESRAGTWDERKASTQKLLKKYNMVTEDRFEIVYAQKITDRISNHFAYILKDTETGVEYLIYTVGKGDATLIENMAITPLLKQSEQSKSFQVIKEQAIIQPAQVSPDLGIGRETLVQDGDDMVEPSDIIEQTDQMQANSAEEK